MTQIRKVGLMVASLGLLVVIAGGAHGAWVKYTGTGSGQGCPFGFTEGQRPGSTEPAPKLAANSADPAKSGETTAVDKSLPAGPVKLSAEDVAKLHLIAFDAARQGDVATLAAFFEAGFDVNIVNDKGDTLLILATYYGHEEAVGLILDQPGVKLDVKNRMGFAALTGAVYKNQNGIVKRLIAGGADVNSVNGSGQTPLMFAALFGREEAARLLIEAGAKTDARDASGNTALKLAQSQNNLELVRLLSKG
jgi:ankyrin repeat protein